MRKIMRENSGDGEGKKLKAEIETLEIETSGIGAWGLMSRKLNG